MVDLNEISAHEIGRRLRLARENAGIRQDEAAKIIGLSRPTLVSIEKGTRCARIEEIQRLAHQYRTSANALLRREAVHTDLIPRFRKLQGTDGDTAQTAQLLNNLVSAEVELENVLGIMRPKIYPPERGIADGNVSELAEQHAKEVRNWLGLGSGPIADIFTLIEFDLCIRLYQRHLPSNSKIAGLFAYDHSVGACLFLNANHSLERRVQSAAHELGHFVGARHVPEVLMKNEQFKSREKRYADMFGRAFLTPRKSFAQIFRLITSGSEKLTRRHVILLAHQFHISREACVRRLEELTLVKKGTWDWFEANGGISRNQTKEVLGDVSNKPDPAKDDANHPISHRMSLMVYEAWKRNLISEGQLADLLNVRRVDLRRLVDEIEFEESVSSDVLKLIH